VRITGTRSRPEVAAGDALRRLAVVVAEPDAGDEAARCSPTNQASRKSWLVPVLPAVSQPGISPFLAVPMEKVSRIIRFMAADRAGLDDRPRPPSPRLYRTFPAAVSPRR
jgi:hypothetical protein